MCTKYNNSEVFSPQHFMILSLCGICIGSTVAGTTFLFGFNRPHILKTSHVVLASNGREISRIKAKQQQLHTYYSTTAQRAEIVVICQ